jgi:hypothetical protein
MRGLIGSFITGVSATDPFSYIIVAAIVTATAGLDPATTLRLA